MRVIVYVLLGVVAVLGAEVWSLARQVQALQVRPTDYASHDEVRALRHQVHRELTSVRTRLNWDESATCPNATWAPEKFERDQKALADYDATLSPLLD